MSPFGCLSGGSPPSCNCRCVHAETHRWGSRGGSGREPASRGAPVAGACRGAKIRGQALPAARGGGVHLPLAPRVPHATGLRAVLLPRGGGVRLELCARAQPGGAPLGGLRCSAWLKSTLGIACRCCDGRQAACSLHNTATLPAGLPGRLPYLHFARRPAVLPTLDPRRGVSPPAVFLKLNDRPNNFH